MLIQSLHPSDSMEIWTLDQLIEDKRAWIIVHKKKSLHEIASSLNLLYAYDEIMDNIRSTGDILGFLRYVKTGQSMPNDALESNIMSSRNMIIEFLKRLMKRSIHNYYILIEDITSTENLSALFYPPDYVITVYEVI